METRDSSQVAQPLAEKGGLYVIPWRGKVRFHENIDGPLISQVWFPPVIDGVVYRQHWNCLSAPPVGFDALRPLMISFILPFTV